jgi:hypothetical protein
MEIDSRRTENNRAFSQSHVGPYQNHKLRLRGGCQQGWKQASYIRHFSTEPFFIKGECGEA